MNACVSTEGDGARAGISRQRWEGALPAVESLGSTQAIATVELGMFRLERIRLKVCVCVYIYI